MFGFLFFVFIGLFVFGIFNKLWYFLKRNLVKLYLLYLIVIVRIELFFLVSLWKFIGFFVFKSILNILILFFILLFFLVMKCVVV